MEDKGWIKIPYQCRAHETLPAHTLNFPCAFPDQYNRTFPAISNLFGFKHAQDVDQYGKNIFHYMFGGMKYCWFLADLMTVCFNPDHPKLPGDYTLAMKQQVTSGTPKGWTPPHCLLKNSDILLRTKDVVVALIDNGILAVEDFAELVDPYVSVFWVFVCIFANRW